MTDPTLGEVAYTAYVAALRPSVVRYLTALYANLGPDEHAAWEAAAQAVLTMREARPYQTSPLIPDVQVAGRRMLRMMPVFERDCLQMIFAEQKKLAPDNALIALLCDAVRLSREHTDSQQI